MMELDLDFPVVGVARERELTPRDLVETKAAASPLRRLRDRHHALARECAIGLKSDKQIALEHNYTPATLTRLRSDSAFIELVEYYRRGLEANERDALSRLRDLSHDAMDELADRLESEPDSFTNGQLMELTKLTTDRTGFGPSTKTEVNVNLGFGSRLAAAAARMKTIEHEPVRNLIDEQD